MWFFALVFGKYTTVMCGIEYIFHALVGGAGFYFLAKHFAKDRLPAFVAAAFYLLSGFFVGNGQHLSWIISAAWLPWVLFSFVKLMEEPSLRTMLLFPVVFSLMLTGGYPGFVFVLAYVLVAIFILYLVRGFRNNRKGLVRMLAFLIGAAAITLCLCAPVLYSFWEVRDEITRGAALDFDKTAEPFTARGLISLIFPHIGVGERSFTGTDPTMGSIYMGMLALPAIFVGLRKNRQPLLWLLFGTAVLALVAAFGTHIPANRLAFEHLPLLDHIRLPGLYRLFFIVPMLLVAATGISYIKDNWPEQRKTAVRTMAVVAGLFVVIAIAAGIVLASHPSSISLWQKVLAGALIGIATFSASVIAMRYAKATGVLAIVAVAMLAEPVVQANICGPETVYNLNGDRIQLSRATSTEGFPVPDSLSYSRKLIEKHQLHALWTNVGMFVKEVEYESYNPFQLYCHKRMLRPYDEADSALVLPIAFFPTTVIYDTLPHFLSPDTAFTERAEGRFGETSHNAELEISTFEPGKVVISTQTTEPRPLVLCQNIYKGWTASIDGKSATLETLNYTMLSVSVPAGKHEVVFEYRRPELKWLFVMQIIGTVLCLAI
ncbi:MAG: YfhO family protein, partial [Bacteroidales bacterium]|nr:YfhO family protein [Bacteroidales bacterium]